MTATKKATAVLLSALLCIATVPALALSYAAKAWAADEEVYAMYYRAPCSYDYTLVIQKGNKADSRYGTLVESKVGVVDDSLYNWGDDEYPDWEEQCNCGLESSQYDGSVTRVIVKDVIAPHQISFKGFSRCVSMDLAKLDTSKMTSMYSMFRGCNALKSLNLSRFNTANVKDMSWMFYDCESLAAIDTACFNTANVEDMSWMFYDCESLTAIDVSHFSTAKVTDVSCMFGECDSLTSLDISNFNLSKVVDRDSLSGMLPTWESSLALIKLPASADFRNVMPTPKPEYVDGAVGTWVSSSGKVYKPDGIPPFKADTYKAKRGYSVKNGYIEWPGEDNYYFGVGYTGKSIKPKFKVIVAGKTLVKGRDYTVTFKNNKKVGTAKVTVKGKGNYSGKLSGTFTIEPPKVSIKKAKGIKKGIKVTWKKVSKSAIKNKQVTGYAIKVTTDKKGSKEVSCYIDLGKGEGRYGSIDGAKRTSAVIKGLKSKKKYYVFVAAFKQSKDGSNWYESEWSKPKMVKTK